MSGKLFGIDIGPEHSAYCVLDAGTIGAHAWLANDHLLQMLRKGFTAEGVAVVESPQAQDRPLGPQLRNTIFWAGRFVEALASSARMYREVEERDVSVGIVGSGSPSNAAILQALKTHFGDARQEACECKTGQVQGSRGPKKCPACKGNKFLRVPSAIAGLNEHERSALAAALYVWQKRQPLAPA